MFEPIWVLYLQGLRLETSPMIIWEMIMFLHICSNIFVTTAVWIHFFMMYSSRCICPDTFVIVVQIFEFVRIYLWSQTAASCFSSGLTAARHSLEVIWEKVQSKLVSIHNIWQTSLKQSWQSFHSHNICLSESWNIFVATNCGNFLHPVLPGTHRRPGSFTAVSATVTEQFY